MSWCVGGGACPSVSQRLTFHLDVDLAPPSSETTYRMEIDLAQDDAAFRDRSRIAPLTKQPTAGRVSHFSTREDIENALRNPIQYWPAYEVMLPMGEASLSPRHPFLRPPSEGVPPHRVVARVSNDPVSLALEAHGAWRISQRACLMSRGKVILRLLSKTRPLKCGGSPNDQKTRLDTSGALASVRALRLVVNWPMVRKCLFSLRAAREFAKYLASFPFRPKSALRRQ